MSIYDYLKGIACCTKEDLPEVEAVKRVVEPLARRFWLRKIHSATDYVIESLDSYRDVLGSEDVDVLVDGGRKRKELELASLLATLEERLGCPFDESTSQTIEDASGDLLVAGAIAVGLFPLIRSPRAALQSRRALYMGLNGRITPERWGDVSDALGEALTDRSLRTALRAPVRTSAQAALVTAWKSRLKEPMGSRWTSWGPQTVDSWAYRTEVTGRFLAGEQAGVTSWHYRATIDPKTTLWCRWINTRSVPMGRVRAQLAAWGLAVNQGNLSALRGLWPLGVPNSVALFPAHFKRVGLPGFHFGCRTVIVPA